MYGNIVSSNGLKQIEPTQDEVIINLEKPVNFISLHIDHETMVYFNDDPDGIYLPVYYAQPFIIKEIPVWKVKIKRYGHSLSVNNYGEKSVIYYSYYGMY